MFKLIRSQDRRPPENPRCHLQEGVRGGRRWLQGNVLRPCAFLGLVAAIVALAVGLVEYRSDRQEPDGSDGSSVQVNITHITLKE